MQLMQKIDTLKTKRDTAMLQIQRLNYQANALILAFSQRPFQVPRNGNFFKLSERVSELLAGVQKE